MYFLEMSKAQAVATISGAISTRTYYAGDRTYLCLDLEEKYLQNAEIGQVPYYDTNEVLAAKEALDENSNRRKAYEKALKEWRDQTSNASEARETVMTVYREACSRVTLLKTILSVKEKYVALANGDEHIAGNFLAKAYSKEDISEATYEPVDSTGEGE